MLSIIAVPRHDGRESDNTVCTYIGARLSYHIPIMKSRRLFLNRCKGVCGVNSAIEKQIGQNIRRLREAAGITQDVLATKLQVRGCDITRSAVAKMEVGQRHIYPDEIILIKEILRVDYESLLQTE